MQLEQIWVLSLMLGTLMALIFSNRSPSFIFATTTLLLIISNSIEVNQVMSNLGNQGLVILVLLLLCSFAVDKAGFMKKLSRSLVVRSRHMSLVRIIGLSFFSSAVLNNTAVVATLISSIKHNRHIVPSKLLIPLSYAAILGGTVTLIGTSTNLIVDSFLIETGHPGFSFFDFTLYGLTAGLTCCLLLFVCSPLLPETQLKQDNFKRYIIEAEVDPNSALIGRTVEANHLRNLPELFLVEIVRDKRLISPVHPDTVIEPSDKLIFSGNIEKVDSLDHIPGLKLFADSNGLLRENVTEVVVSNRAQLIGKTLKQVGFRSMFDAAVVAIRRDGEALSGKLGEIKLKAGDFLLLATGNDFRSRANLANNFFILSELKLQQKLNRWQDRLSIGGFLATIAMAAMDIIPLDVALMLLLMLYLLSGIISSSEIRRGLPINLVMVIVGALSLAKAMQSSGLITLFTEWLQPMLLAYSPFMALVLIYAATLIMTELVTNNAAAALMFPFAFGVSESMGLPIMPFALAVAFGASASFLSPYGYQTNLLVFSAGEYKFKHFIKIGLPVSLLFSSIVLCLLKWQYQL